MTIKAKNISTGLLSEFTPEQWQVLQGTGEYQFLGLNYSVVAPTAEPIAKTTRRTAAPACGPCAAKRLKSKS